MYSYPNMVATPVDESPPAPVTEVEDVPLSPMEALRAAVSASDASLRELANDDSTVRIEAILDAGALLAAAKAVVLNA